MTLDKKARSLWDWICIGATLVGLVGLVLFGIGVSDLMMMVGLVCLGSWATVAFLNGLYLVWVWVVEMLS